MRFSLIVFLIVLSSPILVRADYPEIQFQTVENKELEIRDNTRVQRVPLQDFQKRLMRSFQVPVGIWTVRPPLNNLVDMYRSWPPYDEALRERQRNFIESKIIEFQSFLKNHAESGDFKFEESSKSIEKIKHKLSQKEIRSEAAKEFNKFVEQQLVVMFTRPISAKLGPEDVELYGALWMFLDPHELVSTFSAIPPGSFDMGSPTTEKGRSMEEALHRVTIGRGFELQSAALTQEEWFAEMGYNPAFFQSQKDCPESFQIIRGIGMCPNNPVEEVSWGDIQNFLSIINKKNVSTHYRLPTEAEWEYAARGGSGSAFYFGSDANKLGEYAWTLENAEGKTHAVRLKKPNAYGLYDMLGNVWHWVQDNYGPYNTQASIDPSGPAHGVDRVQRGGAWNEYIFTTLTEYGHRLNNQSCESCRKLRGKAKYIVHRSAYRAYAREDYRWSDIGFRLLKETAKVKEK